MSRRAPILAAVGVLVVAVVATLALVFPKYRQVGETQKELEAARSQQVVLETELARLQEAKKNAPQLMRQLAKVRRQIPPAADLPGMINLLQDAADVARVDFFSIAPQPPVATGTASEIPASVQVIGSFFEVHEFMRQLETLPRAAKVTAMTLAEGPDKLPQIQITMTIEFFTTDTSAGPGASVPLPGGAKNPAPAVSPSPAATTTEGV